MTALIIVVSAESDENEANLDKRDSVKFDDSVPAATYDHDRNHDYFAKSITLDSGFVPSVGFSYDNFGKATDDKKYENNIVFENNAVYAPNSGLYEGKILDNVQYGQSIPQTSAQPIQYKVIQTTATPLSIPYRKPVVRYTQTPVFKPSARIVYPENKQPKLDKPIIISSLSQKEKPRGGQTYSVSGSYTFGPKKNTSYRKGTVNSVPLGHRYQTSVKQPSSLASSPLKLKRKGSSSTFYRFENPMKFTNSRSSMHYAHKPRYSSFSKKY